MRCLARAPGELTWPAPMLDAHAPSPIVPSEPEITWPDAGKQGLRWVEEARKSAPGLDSLLTWAFRVGRVAHRFSDRASGMGRCSRPQPPRHEDTDRRVGFQPYRQSSLRRRRHGTSAGGQRLRHRLCDSAGPLDAAALSPQRHADANRASRRRQHRVAADRRHAAGSRGPARRAGHSRCLPAAPGHGDRQRGDRLRQIHADCRHDRGEAAGPRAATSTSSKERRRSSSCSNACAVPPRRSTRPRSRAICRPSRPSFGVRCAANRPTSSSASAATARRWTRRSRRRSPGTC